MTRTDRPGIPVGAFAYFLACAATYRAVRLAITDTVFDAPRERLHDWLDEGGRFRQWLYDLVTCQWCLGVWIAAAVTTFLAVTNRWRTVEAMPFVLAVAAGQSFIHMAEDILWAVEAEANYRDDLKTIEHAPADVGGALKAIAEDEAVHTAERDATKGSRE